MILFHFISIIVCLVTYCKQKNINMQIDKLNTLIITNLISMIVLCTSEVFSILAMPNLFMISIILFIPTIAITALHINFIKRLNLRKKEEIQKSVI